MIVLVCGGRAYRDHRTLGRELDRVHAESPISLVVVGAATGADSLAWAWAVNRGIAWKAFRAEWESFGRAAGPIRNKRMLDEAKPDLVIAFPGNSGTKDMCTRAREAGVPVTVIV